MRMFKAITKTEGATRTESQFVDWYSGNESEVRAQWDEDCFRYGLPKDKTTVKFVEVNPDTLQPISR